MEQSTFYHPDYTVGFGISPNRLHLQFTDSFFSLKYFERCKTLPSVGNPCKHVTLPRRNYYFYVSILLAFLIFVNKKSINYFMVSWILFFLRSTLMTFTLTISPTLTTSKGCFIKRSVICEICTNPS